MTNGNGQKEAGIRVFGVVEPMHLGTGTRHGHRGRRRLPHPHR